jgi:hypothetical protein
LNTTIGPALTRSLNRIGSIKETRWEKELEYNRKELKEYIEKQFTPEMCWENYGIFWHIDHKIPVSWFTTKEQIIKKGWKLHNLQPLEAKLNDSKNNKYCGNPKTKLDIIYL